MKFLQSNPPATPSQIQVFESLVRMNLPADFVCFLMEHNGGEKPSIDGFKAETGESSMVGLFFGLGLKDSYSDLTINYEYSKPELPSGHIPIGKDIGGNLLTLGLDTVGGVFLWDHERPLPEQKPARCSASFQAFVDALYDSW